MSKGISVGVRGFVFVVLLSALSALMPAVAAGSQFDPTGSPLTPTDATNPANFGVSAALSADGTTALVGADADNGSAGAATVFTRSGSKWTQQGAKLTPSDEVGGGWFGSTVALSADGNTAVVGGRYDNGGVGAVWIFTRNGTTWAQTGQKLVATGEIGGGQLGWSLGVSADGRTIVAGAPADHGNIGAAWVFTESSAGTWSQQEILGSGETGGAQFGWSAGISGDASTVVVGGPNDNSNAGAAWFYTDSANGWVQQGTKVAPSDATSGAQFGASAALSGDGNTALIGATADNSSAGAAWIYTRSASTWSQATSKLVPKDESGSASFGSSVGLSSDGHTAIIGGPGDSGAGAAWIYSGSGSTWFQQESKLTASGTGSLGWGVAVSSDASTALAGSPGPGSGSAYAFLAPSSPPPGALTQLAAPNNCIEDSSDAGRECGIATGVGLRGAQDVAVSPDGKNVYVLANGIGAIAEFARNADGSLTQLGGANACIGEHGFATGCQTTGYGLSSAAAIVVSPDGKNVYVVGFEGSPAGGAIAEFSRDPTTGALSQPGGASSCIEEHGYSGCAITTGHGLDNPYGLSISPDGTSVYVADGGTGTQHGAVAEFSRDPTTGTLAQLPSPNDCIEEHGGPGDCGTTGTGLFVVNRVMVSSDNKNVYTAIDNTPGAIAEFSRDPMTGALTQLASPNNCIQEPGGTTQYGAGDCGTETGLGINDVYGLDGSPDGRNVYSASIDTTAPIAEFSRDPSTGALTQLAGSNNCIEEQSGSGQVGCGNQTGHGLSGAWDLKVSPDGNNVYVVSSGGSAGNSVVALARNSDGSLTQLASPNDCIQEVGGTDCGTRSGRGINNPLGLAISPDGANVYVVASVIDSSPNDVAEFARAQTTSPGGGGGGGGSGGGGSGSPAGTPGGGGTPGGAAALAVTHAPVVLSSSAAAFSGTVNPSGLATTAYFQYGLDASYGTASDGVTYTNSTAPQSIGAGSSPVTVSATAAGLVPNAVYHVRLVASNGAGTTYGADVTFNTKKDPLPPPPVLGKSFDIALVAGKVLIRLPVAAAADSRLSPRLSLAKGQGFIPLTEARQLPTGTQIDARQGTIQLVSAASQPHKTQTGTFTGGLYGLAQDRLGLTKGLTTLSLLEGLFPGAPTYSTCSTRAAGDSAYAAALSTKVLQTLHGSDHGGRFRTRGHYSAATVRGTVWTMSDRCDGTLTSVQRGTVSVSDFVRHVTLLVHAGHHYLARAKRR